MKVYVIAKPNAKRNRLEQIDETHYRIWVKAAPEQGEANTAVLSILASHLGLPRTRLTLLAGHKSKQKIIGF